MRIYTYYHLFVVETMNNTAKNLMNIAFIVGSILVQLGFHRKILLTMFVFFFKLHFFLLYGEG